ncbi:hypothetical protein GCM10009680_61260 [Streptomyces yatensis]|uniref:Uncharacterized protein n=1 Tax=Streptomyces yatensis TaxID=155177 RepID=A0ABP4UVB8_9ACTN
MIAIAGELGAARAELVMLGVPAAAAPVDTAPVGRGAHDDRLPNVEQSADTPSLNRVSSHMRPPGLQSASDLR